MVSLLLFQNDIVSKALDLKAVGLAAASVSLFLISSAFQMLINNKLDKLKVLEDKLEEVLKEQREHKGRDVEILSVLNKLAQETHEQWGKQNELLRYAQENNIRCNDIAGTIDSIGEQQTVLATAQLNQTQSTQKVIDSLLDVLQEQARD